MAGSFAKGGGWSANRLFGSVVLLNDSASPKSLRFLMTMIWFTCRQERVKKRWYNVLESGGRVFFREQHGHQGKEQKTGQGTYINTGPTFLSKGWAVEKGWGGGRERERE